MDSNQVDEIVNTVMGRIGKSHPYMESMPHLKKVMSSIMSEFLKILDPDTLSNIETDEDTIEGLRLANKRLKIRNANIREENKSLAKAIARLGTASLLDIPLNGERPSKVEELQEKIDNLEAEIGTLEHQLQLTTSEKKSAEQVSSQLAATLSRVKKRGGPLERSSDYETSTGHRPVSGNYIMTIKDEKTEEILVQRLYDQDSLKYMSDDNVVWLSEEYERLRNELHKSKFVEWDDEVYFYPNLEMMRFHTEHVEMEEHLNLPPDKRSLLNPEGLHIKALDNGMMSMSLMHFMVYMRDKIEIGDRVATGIWLTPHQEEESK